MSSTTRVDKIDIPTRANFIAEGEGQPIVMIHGLAASLHDWDFILPELVTAGYSCYALDLLGHGVSPKPDLRGYQIDWIYDHFILWFESLQLNRSAVFIGHSLGGYIALEVARSHPEWIHGLVLVDPLFSLDQLPALMRFIYRYPVLSGFVAHKTPEVLLRMIIDISSLSMGHSAGGLHALPERVRAQTALDYTRTAPGVYNVLNGKLDLTPNLASITIPSLVLWGDHDQTLSPASFGKLVNMLPNAIGRSIQAGHVPHQSNADWFNSVVLEFLASLVEPSPCIKNTSSLRSS